VRRIERNRENATSIRGADQCDPTFCAKIQHRQVPIGKHLTHFCRRNPMFRQMLLVVLIPQQKVNLARPAPLAASCMMMYTL